ncbi:unnamed protein product, partial [Pocillopora meandrina]
MKYICETKPTKILIKNAYKINKKLSGAIKGLALYFIPTNWVSFALLLIEPTRSTTHGWVSTRTSRNSLKSLKNIFFQPIWLKVLSIGTSRSPLRSAIPWSPFQTLALIFILNYFTLALFLLSRKKGFANLLSVANTHLHNSPQCRALCSDECFNILDHVSTTFQLKIKEAIHIQWEKPTLNHQLYH